MIGKSTAAVFTIFFILWGCSSEESAVSYPVSSAIYNELNQQVGCDSKFIEDKKSDLFHSNYYNHWMTWKGQVIAASSEEAALNLDGKGIHDLHVIFADKKGGYDLIQDEVITVRFLMKSIGGCILPFEGNQAVVIRESKP